MTMAYTDTMWQNAEASTATTAIAEEGASLTRARLYL